MTERLAVGGRRPHRHDATALAGTPGARFWTTDGRSSSARPARLDSRAGVSSVVPMRQELRVRVRCALRE